MQIGDIPIFDALELNNHVTGSGIFWYVGTGTPEGAVSAAAGRAYYFRLDGTVAANTLMYYKNTGTGTTGWVTLNISEVDTLQTVTSRGSSTTTSISSSNGTVTNVISYGASNGVLGTTTAHDLLLYTGGTEKLRITTAGVLILNQSAVGLYTGSVSPEGVVTASPGSLYFRTAGGTNTSVYSKSTGTGNTGWLPLLNTATPATTIVSTAVVSPDIQSNAYMNTTYAAAAIGDMYIFTNITDAPGSVATVRKYTSTLWYNSLGYVKNV